MVDQGILKKKIIQVNGSFTMITRYKALTLEEFLDDAIAQNIVEYNLFIIINQLIDMANHIAVDNGYGQIDVLSDGFKLLNKEKYISDKELETYIKMVGFRNIIAHQYIDLSKEIVYNIMKNGLDDIVKFIKIINKEFI